MLTKLLIGLLKIGTVGYGGGAATMPLMKKEFIEKQGMLTEDEFIEILAICNVLPGPLITKYCAVLGYRIKGVIGAILAVIAIILPSCLMLLVILGFLKNAEPTENITNMVNAIFPVVTVILVMLIFDFFKIAKIKLSLKEIGISLVVFGILILGLKLDAAFVILIFVALCMLIPKREGE